VGKGVASGISWVRGILLGGSVVWKAAQWGIFQLQGGKEAEILRESGIVF